MNEIKVKSKKCSLCNSINTNTTAKFIDGQYKLIIDCKNEYCISNRLN